MSDTTHTQRVLFAKQCLYNAATQKLHAEIAVDGNVHDAVEAVQQAHLEYILAQVQHNKTILGMA